MATTARCLKEVDLTRRSAWFDQVMGPFAVGLGVGVGSRMQRLPVRTAIICTLPRDARKCFVQVACYGCFGIHSYLGMHYCSPFVQIAPGYKRMPGYFPWGFPATLLPLASTMSASIRPTPPAWPGSGGLDSYAGRRRPGGPGRRRACANSWRD